MSPHGQIGERFSSLLQSIESIQYNDAVDTDDEYNALQQAGIDLLDILGYSGANIFLDLVFETHEYAAHSINRDEIYLDIVVASDLNSPIHIGIKVFQTPQPSEELIYSAAMSSGARYTVGLSKNYLYIAQHPLDPLSPGEAFKISNITEGEKEYIAEMLSPPDELPEGPGPRFPPGHHPDQAKLTRWLFSESDITPEYQEKVDTEKFSLDLEKYSELLHKSYLASSANEKGDALEDVVEYLFGGLTGVSIRDRNLRTQTREIDIVLELENNGPTIFAPSSRFALIECKNKKAV